MIAALLLSAFVDLTELRARRAALHELARRTEPPPEAAAPPPFGAVLMEGVLRAAPSPLVRTACNFPQMDLMWVLRMLPGIEPESFSMVKLQSHPVFAEHSARELCLPVPVEDLPAFEAARTVEAIRALRWTVRTPVDALLFACWVDDAPTWVAQNLFRSAPSISDWMDSVRPNLTGWSAERILAASAAWHAQFRVGRFRTPCPTALVLLRYPRSGWTLQRLTEKADFAAEGASMGHCVGGPPRANGHPDGESSYWQDARDDRASILSLRDAEGVPHMTIEVKHKVGKIVQIQGPEDKDPSEEAIAHLRLALFWAKGWADAVPVPTPWLFAGVLPVEELRASREFAQLERALKMLSRVWGQDQRPASARFEVVQRIALTLRWMYNTTSAPMSHRKVVGWAHTVVPPAIAAWLPESRFGRYLGGLGVYPEASVGVTTCIGLFDHNGTRVFRSWGATAIGQRIDEDGVVDPYGLIDSTSSVEDLLYAFTGLDRAPPDTSDLVPAIPMPKAAGQRWAVTRAPIHPARALRAAQAPSSVVRP